MILKEEKKLYIMFSRFYTIFHLTKEIYLFGGHDPIPPFVWVGAMSPKIMFVFYIRLPFVTPSCWDMFLIILIIKGSWKEKARCIRSLSPLDSQISWAFRLLAARFIAKAIISRSTC